MSRHAAIYSGVPGSHTVQCTCRAFIVHENKTEQEAEDAFFRHQREVEKMRAKIAGTQPSLAATLKHYEEMAESPDVSEGDRRLWAQMADEIRNRLGHAPTPDEQPELPFTAGGQDGIG